MSARAATLAHRHLDDHQLEAEIARLQRELDRLEDATWPAAGVRRVECMERLDTLHAEIERRRT